MNGLFYNNNCNNVTYVVVVTERKSMEVTVTIYPFTPESDFLRGT